MKRIVLAVGLAALIGSAIATATPSYLFTSVLLTRSTTDDRVNIKTHPGDLTDIVVQEVTIQPGGYSGWHSHPADVLAAVKGGVVALYDADDPTCTPRYVSAGQAWVEEPGHVHFARNEGSVPSEIIVTFVLPAGSPTRTDAPSPGNCPF